MNHCNDYYIQILTWFPSWRSLPFLVHLNKLDKINDGKGYSIYKYRIFYIYINIGFKYGQKFVIVGNCEIKLKWKLGETLTTWWTLNWSEIRENLTHFSRCRPRKYLKNTLRNFSPRDRSRWNAKRGGKKERKAEGTSYHRRRNFIKTLQSTLDFHGRSRKKERVGT